MATVHSFILLGQFGWVTSAGMLKLVEPLKRFGPVVVSPWDDRGTIAAFVNAYKGRVATIGYSLGASQLCYIGKQLTHHIDLGVGYDPSRQSPWTQKIAGEYVQQIMNYDRVICYYNPGTWYYGGAKYVGKGVEIVQINSTHFGVPYISALHEQTIKAVMQLSERFEPATSKPTKPKPPGVS